jgi:phosphoserine phosphatase
MEGRVPFEVALRERLAIARPRRADVAAMAAELAENPTHGARTVVRALQEQGHEVRIVSGALDEVLHPVAAALGIPPDHVHGVTARWREDGVLESVDPTSGFGVSKVEGMRRARLALPRPAVGVGDGATDLALRDAGFVDRFVAYTEHVSREAVVAKADATARSMVELAGVLERLLR